MRLGLSAASLALLAGCAGLDSRGGPIPYDVAGFGAPDQTVAVPLESAYRIGPMDTLSIKVFKMPDLSGDYDVDLTGQLSLPLIGSVKAADMTTAELRDELVRLYGSKYLENPDVSVGIKSSTRNSVTIDGAVNRAGVVPVNASLTLLQAVALAGGAREDANPRRVAVFRTIAGKRQAAAFDLTSIRRGESPDPRVYAGDIVVVDGSTIKSIQKQVLGNLPILGMFRPF
jgi:polysaccharide export outer membrane protein